jgi:hypothetical protein
MDWRDNSDSLVNLSFLLDAPAGKDGHIRVDKGHLVKPGGGRFRIWGINFTGSACFPYKKDAPVVAGHLAGSASIVYVSTFLIPIGRTVFLSKGVMTHVPWTGNSLTGWIILLLN